MHGYNDTGGYAARGCMTEIAYFANTQLTQAQVNTLFNDGKAYDVELDSTLWAATTGYWRNNGLGEWEDKKGTNDINTENVIETLLLPAGVDASRDTQGFIMNRQRTTNSLNLQSADNAGVDAYAYVNDSDVLSVTASGTKSWSFWVKPSIEATRMFICGGDNVNFKAIYIGTLTGTYAALYLEGDENNQYAYSENMTTASLVNKWNHFVITFNAGTVAMYRNGNALTMVDSSHSYPITMNNIGTADNDNTTTDRTTNGQIDDFLVYSDVLGATEVKRIYNAGKRSHRNPAS